MATIQPARCYGLRRTGAVAPGYDADLVVWDSLKEFNAQMVFYNGRRIDDMLRIRPEQFVCDAYRFRAGDPEAVNRYRGEYMSAYSWASTTESLLYWEAIRQS